MTVQIEDTKFDRVSYDADGDVLYLHVGDPRSAVEFDGSEESHGLRYDAEGQLVGITLLNAAWLLERDGEVRVTLPEGRVLIAGRQALEPALGLAART
jgi:YD repeat-containing protein